MLDTSVSREGLLIVKGGQVYLDGWEVDGDGGMCREVAILACLYTARTLYEYASRLISSPGSAPVCMGVPDGTPEDWLCEESRLWAQAFKQLEAVPK